MPPHPLRNFKINFESIIKTNLMLIVLIQEITYLK